jgi:hypothetical protein
LAITVSLGVFVFVYATGGLGTPSQNFANLVTSSGNAISEKFVVEQVTFTTSGGTQGADVYVRNVGTIPIALVSVYVVDQSAGAFISQFTLSPPTTVNVGTFASIPHTTLTFTPLHGHTYSFTLASSLGNTVIFYARVT